MTFLRHLWTSRPISLPHPAASCFEPRRGPRVGSHGEKPVWVPKLFASASSGSATAPRRSSRASTITRTRASNEPVPGLMNVDVGGYHVERHRGRRRPSTSTPTRSGRDVAEAMLAGAEQHHAFRRGAADRRDGAARPDPRRPRQLSARRRAASPTSAAADVARRARASADGRAGLLPAGRLAEGGRILRRAGARGGLRLRQLHAGVHRLEPGMGAALRRDAACRSSATTSRARSAPPSCTARSSTCSATAACGSTAPTSSTSAATPISRTCWSASGWNRRRSPRPRR